MKTYKILLQPKGREAIELIAELAHDRRAFEFARERLGSSPRFASIEVWDGPERLCHLVADAPREACAA